MERKKVLATPGLDFAGVMPHTQVCVLMRIAGERMKFRVSHEGKVKIFFPNDIELKPELSPEDIGLYPVKFRGETTHYYGFDLQEA